MKTAIKRIIKIVSFTVVFILLFSLFQYILQYRWIGEEDLYTRYMDFENQPQDSLDVLYIGTSELYEGIDPIITYASEGITGYNLAVTYSSAVTNYYQLMYALRHHTPKIVVCDFASLFEDHLPSDNEPLYRKIYETMPDKEIKDQLLTDILKLDKSQDYWSWRFSFFRYHSSWKEIRMKNFMLINQYDQNYKLYNKGAFMNSRSYEGDELEIVPETWALTKSDAELSDISVDYYDMLINECKDREIKVLAVIPPNIQLAHQTSSRWNMMKDYFESRSVDYLNYNTYEQVVRMGLCQDHYFDAGHLNTLGAFIFSKTFASDINEMYHLCSRKDDISLFPYWKDNYEKLKEEIPAQQPDLHRCLAIISELDMDAFVYLNDKSKIDLYDEDLNKIGVDSTKLRGSQLAYINHSKSNIYYNQDIGNNGNSNKIPNVEIRYDNDDHVSFFVDNQEIIIEDNSGIIVVAFDNGIKKCVVSF